MNLYRRLSIKQKQVVWAWTFLAIPVLFYTVIRFYPTFGAIVLSFQNWNLLGAKTWAGLENYQKLVADPVFWKVFQNTFIYLLLGTPISLVISFGIAYHLDKVNFLHATIRAMYFLPLNCLLTISLKFTRSSTIGRLAFNDCFIAEIAVFINRSCLMCLRSECLQSIGMI